MDGFENLSLESSPSTIHDLPPELLFDIFSAFAPEDPVPITAGHPALVLSWVSSRWRTVALTCPTLWSTPLFRPKDQLAVCEAWLDRSGDVPLDFALEIGGETYDPERSTRVGVIQGLLGKSLRWRQARISFKDDTQCEMLMMQLRKILVASPVPVCPRLEMVEFQTAGDDSDPINAWALEVVEAAPRLQHLSWELALEPLLNVQRQLVTHPQLSRLQSLSIGTLRGECITDIISILSLVPRLETLSIGVLPILGFPASPLGSPFLHRSILTLSVFTQSHMHWEEWLTLPQLSVLSMSPLPSCQPSGWDGAPLQAMLTRSECQLTSLTIHWHIYTKITSLLTQLSVSNTSLRELSLWAEGTTVSMPNALLQYLTDDASLTSLTRLSLGNINIPHQIKEMRTMVMVRKATLQYLKVGMFSTDEKSIVPLLLLEAFSEMEEGGAVVEYSLTRRVRMY